MTATRTISIKERRQRAMAGRQGGYALAARLTPDEQRSKGQRAWDTRWHNFALEKCRTEEERAMLRANPVEWARRADIWARAFNKRNTEKSMLKRRATQTEQQTKADELMTVSAVALFGAAQLNAARRRIGELEAQLTALRAQQAS